MRQPNKRPIDAAGRMRPTSWPLLLVVASCALLPSPCCAGTLPTMLVESGKPKCVLVSVPMDTQLRVDYEAPGTCNAIYYSCDVAWHTIV